MHFLTPVNFLPSGPPIIPPIRLWLFGDEGDSRLVAPAVLGDHSD
jgi:hypothetical protein